MLFLLNDTVLTLSAEGLAPAQIDRRFGAIKFKAIQRLGQELFSEQPALQRTHPDRALKLCALIRCKEPLINAALFLVQRERCAPAEVRVRFANLDLGLCVALHIRQDGGSLTPAIVNRDVWAKLAA